MNIAHIHDIGVMVIEQNRTLSLIIKTHLGRMGFQSIYSAQSIHVAEDILVDEAVSETIKLVIADMPVSDNEETFAEEIHNYVNKVSRGRDNVALVIATGESRQSRVTTALSAGAHGYLIKPFTLGSLEQQICRALKCVEKRAARNIHIGSSTRKPPEAFGSSTDRPQALRAPLDRVEVLTS